MKSWHRVGQYVGIAADIRRGKFRIIVYGALDAFGLIGPERNGVAILDEENRTVIADEIEHAETGYFGPSDAQLSRARWLAEANPEAVACFLNACGRNRRKIFAEELAPA
jgi:hypothetical protein